MNFEMFDINSMLMGKEMKTSLSRPKGSENQGGPANFLSRFEEAMKKNVLPSGTVVSGLGEPGGKAISEVSLKNKLYQLMSEAKTPMEFIRALEQIMSVIAKGQLDQLRIDPQGIAILKEMLTGAGFSPEDLDQIFSGLSQSLGGKTGRKNIPADRLLKELALLKPEAQTKGAGEDMVPQDLAVPSSMVSVLQAILYSLGIEKDVADDIMAKATVKNHGIQLNQFVAQLKKLAEQAPDRVFQTPAGDDSFVALFEQLGLPVQRRKDSSDDISMTLNRLINSLETVIQSLKVVDSLETGQQGKVSILSDPKVQTPLESLREIFSGSREKMPSDELSGQDSVVDFTGKKSKKMSSDYQNMKVLMDEVQEGVTSRDAARSSYAKGLLSSLIGHMKVEGKDSGDVMSSEELKKNLITAERKNQGKVFSLGVEKEEARLSADSVAALSEKAAAEGKKETSDMEDSLFRKVMAHEAKDKDKISSQDGVETSGSKKMMGADTVKKAEAPPRPLPVHVIRQVSKGVVKAIQNGENTLRLQLKPASMGRLLITINNLGDSMKVSIMTENQGAKDMLNSNVNELKTILANTGINLEQFDVDMSSDFKQSMAGTQQGFGGSGKKGSNTGGNRFDSNEDGDALASADLPGAEPVDINGSLHYVA